MCPTLSIRTFGCRLNQAESAALAARFAAVGIAVRPANADAADVCLVQACAVTRTAERECLQWVRRLNRRRPRPLIVLSGCLTQAGELTPADRACIDWCVDQPGKWDLPERLRAHFRLAAPEADASPDPRVHPVPRFPGARAWVRIQDGCDFGCAYCIVPRARGVPTSRSRSDVLREARALIAVGYRELVLTGANLAVYRDDEGVDLVALCTELAALPGLGRLRLGSIEPGTIERELIALMASTPRICRSLHLPLQSGDADVLRRMGRRYTPAQYFETAREAVRRLPGLGLGADVIAGFPGEDEAAFARTCAFIEQLPFSNLHVFPYSERPGTPAAELPGAVPPSIRKARATQLIALGRDKRVAFARESIGREVELLVESQDAMGVARGHTAEYLEAELRAPHLLSPGALVHARVHAVRGDQLVLHDL